MGRSEDVSRHFTVLRGGTPKNPKIPKTPKSSDVKDRFFIVVTPESKAYEVYAQKTYPLQQVEESRKGILDLFQLYFSPEEMARFFTDEDELDVIHVIDILQLFVLSDHYVGPKISHQVFDAFTFLFPFLHPDTVMVLLHRVLTTGNIQGLR